MKKKFLKRKSLVSILTTISVVMMCFAGGQIALAEDPLVAISKDTVTAAKSTGVESTVETVQEEDLISVNLFSTDLASHANAYGVEGYWTGFAVTAPDTAKKAKYVFDTEENINWEEATITDSLEENVAEENSGIAFYANAGAENPKTKIMLQWLTDDDSPVSAVTTFVMNLDGVKLNWIKEDSISVAPTTGETAATIETEQNDGVITVKYTATALDKHENSEGREGYWIGFAVDAPADNAVANVTFGDDTYTGLSVENITDTKKGIAFYTNAGSATPKTTATLQWLADDAVTPLSAPTSFVIDITDVNLNVPEYEPIVTEANIADFDEMREIYTEGSYNVEYDAEKNSVAVSVDSLKEHTNANGTEGYWTGFAVEAPANAEKFRYAFGASDDLVWENELVSTENIDGNGKMGAAFITDASADAPKKYVRLQWFDENNNAVTDEVNFEMNLDNVKLNWILAETVELAPTTGTAEVTLETEQNDGVITVKYTAAALDKHENGVGDNGYWIGFVVEAPGDSVKANVTFGTDTYTDLSLENISETKKGIAFYTNAGTAQPKTNATLQWVDGEGNSVCAPTEFVIDISGVVLSGLPYITTDDVTQAKIVDNANIGVKPYKNYSVSTVSAENGAIIVDIDMTSLKAHKNGADASGYWTGFAVIAPDSAATLRYAFSASKRNLVMNSAAVETGVATINEIEKNGVAFYTDTISTPKKYVRLQWFDENGEAITNVTEFEMDLSGVEHYQEYVRSSGGGKSSNYYTINFETNGGNKITSVKVKKEESISAPLAPVKNGYKFDGWYIDKELTQSYDFSSAVTKSFTLYAKWTENESKTISFEDVKKNAWYYDAVCEAVEQGLMNGISENEFAPELNITRGMFVTILYRAAGEPTVNKKAEFADVDAQKYYASAVVWANDNEIVNGMTKTLFAPDDNITREQMATMLYRFVKAIGKSTEIEGEIKYIDTDMISDYAEKAIIWANAVEIMKGNEDNSFTPLRNATRAEAAAVFVRLMELIK